MFSVYGRRGNAPCTVTLCRGQFPRRLATKLSCDSLILACSPAPGLLELQCPFHETMHACVAADYDAVRAAAAAVRQTVVELTAMLPSLAELRKLHGMAVPSWLLPSFASLSWMKQVPKEARLKFCPARFLFCMPQGGIEQNYMELRYMSKYI